MSPVGRGEVDIRIAAQLRLWPSSNARPSPLHAQCGLVVFAQQQNRD
jgi:hypothetical protein